MSLTQWLHWLWSPIRLLWAEAIGLRTEQIRSLSVVTGIVFLFRGYDHIDHGDSLFEPQVVITLICLVLTFLLAWQANSIKGQWGEAMISLGRDPDPNNRATVSSTAPMGD